MKTIQELQKENKLKNKDVAKVLNISPSTYCDKLRGRRKFQPLEIVQLCKLFNENVENIKNFLVRDTRKA